MFDENRRHLLTIGLFLGLCPKYLVSLFQSLNAKFEPDQAYEKTLQEFKAVFEYMTWRCSTGKKLQQCPKTHWVKVLPNLIDMVKNLDEGVPRGVP